jgi:hypothetical protein
LQHPIEIPTVKYLLLYNFSNCSSSAAFFFCLSHYHLLFTSGKSIFTIKIYIKLLPDIFLKKKNKFYIISYFSNTHQCVEGKMKNGIFCYIVTLWIDIILIHYFWEMNNDTIILTESIFRFCVTSSGLEWKYMVYK